LGVVVEGVPPTGCLFLFFSYSSPLTFMRRLSAAQAACNFFTSVIISCHAIKIAKYLPKHFTIFITSSMFFLTLVSALCGKSSFCYMICTQHEYRATQMIIRVLWLHDFGVKDVASGRIDRVHSAGGRSMVHLLFWIYPIYSYTSQQP
jgi:hypothetical protein